jgi:hypothetical protein
VFAVTEAAVALTADEKVARTRNEGVTEEFFGVGDYLCYTVVDKKASNHSFTYDRNLR